MTQSLAAHAARLLVLIHLAGRPQTKGKWPAIQGRTLLAKLDFFVRYPEYLRRAAASLGYMRTAELETVPTVESRMVRFRYGPWDHDYYPTLAYMIGKNLIDVVIDGGTESFRLTERGRAVADELIQLDEFAEMASRARVAYHLFNRYSGNRLKQFIYDEFPEVVARPIGEEIG